MNETKIQGQNVTVSVWQEESNPLDETVLQGQNVTLDVRQEELNLLDENVRIIGLVMMAIGLALSVLLAAWVLWKREAPVVKQMQPIFLVLLCIGSLISATAIYPLGSHDQNASDIDVACMAWPWLHYLGNTISFSALFSKLWRVNQIFHAEGFQRKVVTVRDVMGPLVILLSVNVTLLTLMSVLSPRVWVRKPVDDSNPNDTIGYCEFETSLGEVLDFVLALVTFVALITLCVQAYRARDIKSEFSEARGVALALFTWLNTTLIGAPTALTLNPDDTDSIYMLYVSQQFVNLFSLMFFIFAPLISHDRQHSRRESNSTTGHTRISGLNLNTGSNPPTSRPSWVSNQHEQHPNVPDMVLELKALRARVAELEQQAAKPNKGETTNPAELQEEDPTSGDDSDKITKV